MLDLFLFFLLFFLLLDLAFSNEPILSDFAHQLALDYGKVPVLVKYVTKLVASDMLLPDNLKDLFHLLEHIEAELSSRCRITDGQILSENGAGLGSALQRKEALALLLSLDHAHDALAVEKCVHFHALEVALAQKTQVLDSSEALFSEFPSVLVQVETTKPLVD